MGDKIFAEKLKELIKTNNITQKELAKRIGQSERSISHYLKGTREPKIETLKKLTITLHTTADYLLGLCDNINRK